MMEFVMEKKNVLSLDVFTYFILFFGQKSSLLFSCIFIFSPNTILNSVKSHMIKE